MPLEYHIHYGSTHSRDIQTAIAKAREDLRYEETHGRKEQATAIKKAIKLAEIDYEATKAAGW